MFNKNKIANKISLNEIRDILNLEVMDIVNDPYVSEIEKTLAFFVTVYNKLMFNSVVTQQPMSSTHTADAAISVAYATPTPPITQT